MIVVVAIVALLAGLALPPLGRVRESARASISRSNLRGIGLVLQQYLARYREVFPSGGEGALYATSFDGETVRESFGHFEFGRVWPVLMRDVAPWSECWRTWISPGDPQLGSVLATTQLDWSYRYSIAFLGRPELWGGLLPTSAEPNPATYLRPTRAGEVAFPSAKVVAWDGRMAYLLKPVEYMPGMLGNPTPMLFVDGHVSDRRPRDATPPATNPLNMGGFGDGQPLHNTSQGVRGRDY